MLLKIGELAKRTGLTVRTLHHYDTIGLLTPSARSDAGYRLYDRADIARLHRVQALRRLDLSLAEIGVLLAGAGADLQSVIEQQIVALERQVVQAAALRDRLKDLVASVAGAAEPNLDGWLTTLEMMTMYSKYFTDEEVENLRRRRGSSKLTLSAEWLEMVAAVRGLIDKETPPQSAQAATLAKRWMRLAQQTMGDDPRFFLKLEAMHRNESSVQVLTGIDGTLIDYISQAAFEVRLSLYARYFNAGELVRTRISHRKNMQHWRQLIAETRQQMAHGAAPEQPEVQALIQRWNVLHVDAWGDDPIVRQRVRAAHQAEPELLMGSGIDPAMIAFVQQGFSHFDSHQSE
ncbi:MAG TPA: MerR family transcriptional regulator [Oxalobacteraceae bacterium]|jgi:DNA-binding transcriptional MerR regulator|nr:MerR family transcriptional regulator [Oxalobacteraceae bacterium]HCN90322.1 MerR family transcriptional regulator [Oxalobacteraceae bacterium]